MKNITSGDTIDYDNFDKHELNTEKWKILQFPSGENELWTYADPNAKTEVKDNTLHLEVNPFTKQHPDVAVFDNPKHLYYSIQQFSSPDSGCINFQADVSMKAFNNDDRDLRDAFGSFHIMDFKNGIVLDFIGNNKKFGIIYERLLIPGVPEEDAFTDVIELRVKRADNKFHTCKFSYNKSEDSGKIFVDEKEYFNVTGIPVKVNEWVIGIGVCTLDKLRIPLHGQGAGIKVKNIKVWNSN
jgi:hypothetical protein